MASRGVSHRRLTTEETEHQCCATLCRPALHFLRVLFVCNLPPCILEPQLASSLDLVRLVARSRRGAVYALSTWLLRPLFPVHVWEFRNHPVVRQIQTRCLGRAVVASRRAGFQRNPAELQSPPLTSSFSATSGAILTFRALARSFCAIVGTSPSESGNA